MILGSVLITSVVTLACVVMLMYGTTRSRDDRAVLAARLAILEQLPRPASDEQVRVMAMIDRFLDEQKKRGVEPMTFFSHDGASGLVIYGRVP